MAEEPKIRRRPGRTPWLRIAHAVPLSFDVRKIVMGTVALILIQSGALVLHRLAPGAEKATPNLLDIDGDFGVGRVFGRPLGETFTAALGRVAEPPRVLIRPLQHVFSINQEIAGTGRSALELLWAVVVMGIVGGAISRSAVAEAARGDRATPGESLRFALRSARSLIAAPLFPIAAAAICASGCMLIGLLYQAPGVGGAAATVTLFIPMGLGFVAALLLIELAAALPFIHVSVAADAESSLDALTRAFGYVNRRPVQFVACVAAAWLAGAALLVVVDLIAGMTIHLAAWGLSFTAPSAIVAGLARPLMDAARADSIEGAASFFWAKVVRLLAHGWIYSYYWCAAAAIYLVLRRDVDGSPLSEVKDDAIPML